MDQDRGNPFASPESEAVQPPRRKPTSVRIAIFCIVACIGVYAASNAYCWIDLLTDPGEIIGLMPIVLGLFSLTGLSMKSRFAWLWTRRAGFVFAGLLTLVLLGISALIVEFAITTSFFTDDSPGVVYPSLLEIVRITAVLPYTFAAWTIFISLGRETSRQYFGLNCPACDSQRVKAADYLYRKAKCKGCGAVW